MMKMSRKRKGALTVEAVISFSIFVSFMFLLLSMVKISLVKITLDNAVTETAKYIANASYPIGMFNDIAEETDKNISADIKELKLVEKVNQKGISAMFDIMFADTKAEAVKADKAGVDAIFNVLKDSGIELAKGIVLNGASKLISKYGTEVAGNILLEVLDNSYVDINKNNLTLKVAKLPVPRKTYLAHCNSAAFTNFGLNSGDFNEDDVVVGVEYIYKVSMPFLPAVDIVMQEVAVEHAWINGGAGNVTKRTEGIVLTEVLEKAFGKGVVYVTKYGKKYHKEDCYYLWSGKTSEMKKNIAKAEGYEACSKCAP